MAGNNAKLYAYRVKELPWAKGSINYFSQKKAKRGSAPLTTARWLGKIIGIKIIWHINKLLHPVLFIIT